jgi:hypothetical protein
MKKNILFLSFLLCSMVLSGQESTKISQDLLNHYPLPTVDKRTELLSIVFRLAGNFEYNDDIYRSYVSDIHSHFDQYKDHPLIAFATKMRNKNGVSFDAVQAMAIHLEQPPALNPVIPFSAEVPEKRWGKENADKFVELLKQFYTDARCEEFFAKHDGLYKTAQERYIPVYNALDVHWFGQYYGVQPEGSRNIVIGLGLGGGNFGAKVNFPGGKEDTYAIMGTWSIDSTGNPVYTVGNNLPTIIHEFNHSSVNPLTKKHENEFEQPGK